MKNESELKQIIQKLDKQLHDQLYVLGNNIFTDRAKTQYWLKKENSFIQSNRISKIRAMCDSVSHIAKTTSLDPFDTVQVRDIQYDAHTLIMMLDC